MKTKGFPGVLTVVALLLWSAGCGSSDGLTDQQAITQILDSDPAFSADLFDTAATPVGGLPTGGPSSEAGSGPVVAPLLDPGATLPEAWWRYPTSSERTVLLTFSSTRSTAYATVDHAVAGTLFVVRDISPLDYFARPFHNDVTRSAVLIKPGGTWRLAAFSPPWALSVPAPTVRISQIACYAGTRAATAGAPALGIIDPSALIALGDIPSFARSTPVTITARVFRTGTSPLTPAQFVFLHRPAWMTTGTADRLHRTREPMSLDSVSSVGSTTFYTYSLTFIAGRGLGGRLAAIDAVDSSVFMDSSAPYDSEAWGLPYIVLP